MIDLALELVVALVAWMVSPRDVVALQRTAPSLTEDAAVENIAAARVAAMAYRIDPDLLLAIAYRESRYKPDAIGPLVRGKRACGVMQPVMRKQCSPPHMIDGYLEGAQHLRGWVKATRTRRDALIGYAGGYSMIDACRRGPLMRERAGRRVDLCTTPELHRVAWIKRERTRHSTSAANVW